MSTTSRDRAVAAGLAALLLTGAMTLTSCSGGDSKADAQPRPTSSGSGSTPASPTATSTATSSATSSSGVAPATGKVIDTSYFTLRAPEHYSVDVQGEDFSIAVNGAADIGIGIIPESGDEPTLVQLARKERGQVDRLKKAPLGRTTTIGGEPAYLLLATGPLSVTSQAGLSHDDHWIYVTVDSYGSRAQNQRILQSMLASWQWK